MNHLPAYEPVTEGSNIPPPPPYHRVCRRILNVHKNLQRRTHYSATLSLAGFVTCVVADDEEAREAMNTAGFQLVVTDIFLPGMEGDGLLRNFHDSGHSLIAAMLPQDCLGERSRSTTGRRRIGHSPGGNAVTRAGGNHQSGAAHPLD